MRQQTSTEKAHPAAPQGRRGSGRRHFARSFAARGAHASNRRVAGRTDRPRGRDWLFVASRLGNVTRSFSFFLQRFAGKCALLYDAWRHFGQRRANEPHRVDTARRLGFDPYAFLARRHFFFRLPQAARLAVCRHYGLCFGRDYPQLVKSSSLIRTNKEYLIIIATIFLGL